jgi:hypothetical protein
VLQVTQQTVTYRILGRTPLVCNAMSAKVKQGLILPAKKNKAEQQATMKHNPPEEYRSSVYRSPEGPSRIVFPAVGFKRALADAAKDMPGAAKAQIGRLTYVTGEYVPIYGVPKLWMAVTRMADIAHTPDVRSRAIIPEWASELTLTFITPILKAVTVANLLTAAGLMRGIGDGRPEKGWGSYGQFEIVGNDEQRKRWEKLVKTGGTTAQDVALRDPHPYDAETAELLAWWQTESVRRGFKVA